MSRDKGLCPHFNSDQLLKLNYTKNSNPQVRSGGSNAFKTNPFLESGLTFSFTLPPIPPSVSDLKIEKAKAHLGLDVVFFFFPPTFAKYFQFLLFLRFKHGKIVRLF